MNKNILKIINDPKKALKYVKKIPEGLFMAIAIKILNYFITVRIIPVEVRFGHTVTQINNFISILFLISMD